MEFNEYLKSVNKCEPEDPLLSETPLGDRLRWIPLNQLNPSDLKDLYHALNVKQLIPTTTGLYRDYRGFAAVMQFKAVDIDRFERTQNPMNSLIKRLLHEDRAVSLNDLVKSIEKIERFDLIDDLLPYLINLANRASTASDLKLVPVDISNQIAQQQKSTNQLTVDDTPKLISMYDAFICHAPEDIDHAEELMALLETHNISCATADSLLPGQFEYDSLSRCIEERCRKVIVIITPNFCSSEKGEFQIKFAIELAMRDQRASGSPRLIPIVYERYDVTALPSIMKMMSKIDLTRQIGRQWSTKQLIRSLSSGHENEYHNR